MHMFAAIDSLETPLHVSHTWRAYVMYLLQA